MTPLTPLVETVLARDFPAAARSALADLLGNDCGTTLPLVGGADPIERIRLAVLKLAAGRADAVAGHIALAQRDWRDVLVAAGFGHDLQAHRAWARQERA